MTQKQNMDAEHALRLMQTALELIDKSGLAVDAAAHLDLAIHRLTAALKPDACVP